MMDFIINNGKLQHLSNLKLLLNLTERKEGEKRRQRKKKED